MYKNYKIGAIITVIFLLFGCTNNDNSIKNAKISAILDTNVISDSLIQKTRLEEPGYWLFWSRHGVWCDPIIFSLHKNEDKPFIITSIYDGIGLYGFCNLIFCDTAYITNSQLDSLENELLNVDMNIDYKVSDSTKGNCYDGDYWFFEKVSNSDRQLIERRCPKRKNKEITAFLNLFTISDFYKKNTILKFKILKSTCEKYIQSPTDNANLKTFLRSFEGMFSLFGLVKKSYRSKLQKVEMHKYYIDYSDCIILDSIAVDLISKADFNYKVFKEKTGVYDYSDSCNSSFSFEGIADTIKFKQLSAQLFKVCNYVINDMNFEELNNKRKKDQKE